MKFKSTKTLLERFMEKVNSDWQWIGSKFSNGYGQIQVSGEPRGAHRVSYELFNGPIPNGMFVLHSCDDRGCVNPEHLHLGTHIDNMQERKERNHKLINCGSKHGSSKLTESQVLEIRDKSKAGVLHRDLGKEYGVCQSNIGYVIKRGWKHIPEPQP